MIPQRERERERERERDSRNAWPISGLFGLFSSRDSWNAGITQVRRHAWDCELGQPTSTRKREICDKREVRKGIKRPSGDSTLVVGSTMGSFVSFEVGMKKIEPLSY